MLDRADMSVALGLPTSNLLPLPRPAAHICQSVEAAVEQCYAGVGPHTRL